MHKSLILPFPDSFSMWHVFLLLHCLIDLKVWCVQMQKWLECGWRETGLRCLEWWDLEDRRMHFLWMKWKTIEGSCIDRHHDPHWIPIEGNKIWEISSEVKTRIQERDDGVQNRRAPTRKIFLNKQTYKFYMHINPKYLYFLIYVC